MIINTQSPLKKTIINISILCLMICHSSCELSFNAQHNIEEDPNVDVTLDIQAPSAPENLENGTIQSNSYQLNWDASTDNVAVAGYHIYRDGSYLADSISTSYIDISVDSDTEYTYQVSAYDAAGNESDRSNSVSGTTLEIVVIDNEAPSIPQNLAAGTLGSSSFPLSWDASNDNIAVEGYYIYRDGAYLAATSATEYTDTTVSDDTEYTYQVSAYDAAGNVSDRSDPVTGTTPEVVSDTEAPTVPSGLTATSIQSYRVTLSWNASTDNIGVTGYRVYRGGSSIGTSTGTTYADSTVAADSSYSYTVAAYDAAGNESTKSAALNVNTPEASGGDQIIADHTIVDDYVYIKDEYIDQIKTMRFVIAGESHSGAYIMGLNLLESLDSKYQVNITWNGTPEGSTSSYLRVSGAMWGDISNSSGWVYDYGEEDWYETSSAITRTKAGILYCNNNSLTIGFLGFGHCYDTSENINYYISATQEYVDYVEINGIQTKIFFTTGTVDYYRGETGYNKYLKDEAVRSYVLSDSSLVLFDYADILCYDDDGSGPNTETWDGHVYPFITSDNVSPIEVGHISNKGALRLGKALWWMMARMLGWDGNP